MAFQQRDMGGVLFRNDRKKPDSNQPDYKGTCLVNGEELEIAAWIKEGKKGKFMSLQFKPMQQPQQGMGDYGEPQAAQRPAPAAPRRPQAQLEYQGEDAPF